MPEPKKHTITPEVEAKIKAAAITFGEHLAHYFVDVGVFPEHMVAVFEAEQDGQGVVAVRPVGECNHPMHVLRTLQRGSLNMVNEMEAHGEEFFKQVQEMILDVTAPTPTEGGPKGH